MKIVVLYAKVVSDSIYPINIRWFIIKKIIVKMKWRKRYDVGTNIDVKYEDDEIILKVLANEIYICISIYWEICKCQKHQRAVGTYLQF